MPRQNTIQLRKGAVSQWIANNAQVLASGEPAFETDTLRLKIGDGSTAWSGLNYIGSKETLSLVRNDTGDIIYAGQTLYVSGIYNNSIPSVAKYVADGSISENLFIGLASSNISNNSNGYATSFGQIDNLNTVGDTSNNLSAFGAPAWTNGTLLYAHPTAVGKLTSIPPTRAILIGTVIYAHGTQGKISVKLKSQGIINELYDVNTGSALTNQYLLYDGSSWIPTSGGIFDSVGIGITAPSGRLHVVSTGIGAIIGSYNEWTNGGKLRVYADDNDSQTQSIKSFISRTGVGLNIAVNGTSYTNTIGSGSGTNIGLYGYASNGSGNYGLYVESGYGYFGDRVGIGTTSPNANLHVNGSGLFSNNIIINGNSPIIELRNARYTPIGNISLENSDTNFITFRGVGTGLCPTNSSSFNSGLKILLRPTILAQPPVAIGLSNNSLWHVVSNTGWNYEWNAGANNLATLSGNGILSVSSGISSQSANFTNNITASGFVVSGGTSSQFLKADGSVDSTTYQGSISDLGALYVGFIDRPYVTSDDSLGNVLLSIDDSFSALYNDNSIVRITGIQNISGIKTFNDTITFTSGLTSSGTINLNNELYIKRSGIFLGASQIPAITFSKYFSDTFATMDTVICNDLNVNDNLYLSTSAEPETSPGLFFSTNGGGVAGISSNIYGDTVYILANNLNNSLVQSATFDAFGINTQQITAEQKFFKIKHPDPESGYSHLQYGSLESPYNGVRLTGKDKLKNGVCEVYLPDYLKHLIHEEDISIQLTNYGHHKMLYVDKIDLKNNKFIVKGYRSKSGGPFNFYWSFTGIRKDVSILIPEQ